MINSRFNASSLEQRYRVHRLFDLDSIVGLGLFAIVGGSCKLPEPGVSPPNPSSANSVQSATHRLESTHGSPSGETSRAPSMIPKDRECSFGMSASCKQRENGSTVVFPGGSPQGPCKLGVKTCTSNQTWGPCVGLVGPEPRDRCEIYLDDSNCNGVPNEGCHCRSGQPPRPCGTDIGVCKAGFQYCLDGLWGSCTGAIGPTPERCDGKGLDEDCDGAVDLEDDDCACSGSEPWVSCTIPGRAGDCSLGAQFCVNGVLSECRPRFQADAESCGPPRSDALGTATGDEDCDGRIDETDSASRPIGCHYYMIDRDRDGWGALGAEHLNRRDASFGCFCDLPERLAKLGFVRAPGFEFVNKDCADDSEGGESVHPKQLEFYRKPSGTLERVSPKWIGGAFDYNCDGRAEREHEGTKRLDCVFNPDLLVCEWSSNNRFWEAQETPACGSTVQIPTCRRKSTAEGEPTCWVDRETTEDIVVRCR